MAVPLSNTKLRVPQGFPTLLEGLTREILRSQPRDIYEFSASYFENLLENRKITDDNMKQEMTEKELYFTAQRQSTSISTDNFVENNAAAIIQNAFREFLKRRNAITQPDKLNRETKMRAIVTINANLLGYITRYSFQIMTNAAIIIQSTMRGWLVRQLIRHSLPDDTGLMIHIRKMDLPFNFLLDRTVLARIVDMTNSPNKTLFRYYKDFLRNEMDIWTMDPHKAETLVKENYLKYRDSEFAHRDPLFSYQTLLPKNQEQKASKLRSMGVELKRLYFSRQRMIYVTATFKNSFQLRYRWPRYFLYKNNVLIPNLLDKRDNEVIAATRIQASYRGYQVRNKMNKEDNKSIDNKKDNKEEEEVDIDLTDPEVQKAASKIQMTFRKKK
ncbi:hypothetical protein SNEBB_005001 [Seison nebaliae]|nr:hypothetical protein SNEBB_005001 [Seison nebaliae]